MRYGGRPGQRPLPRGSFLQPRLSRSVSKGPEVRAAQLTADTAAGTDTDAQLSRHPGATSGDAAASRCDQHGRAGRTPRKPRLAAAGGYAEAARASQRMGSRALPRRRVG